MLQRRIGVPLGDHSRENSLKHMTTRTRLRPREERASPLQSAVTTALDDMKAVNVRVLDVRGLTDIADTMVIASGNSDRHVRSIAERVVEKAKAAGFRPLGTLAPCACACSPWARACLPGYAAPATSISGACAAVSRSL